MAEQDKWKIARLENRIDVLHDLLATAEKDKDALATALADSKSLEKVLMANIESSAGIILDQSANRPIKQWAEITELLFNAVMDYKHNGRDEVALYQALADARAKLDALKGVKWNPINK